MYETGIQILGWEGGGFTRERFKKIANFNPQFLSLTLKSLGDLLHYFCRKGTRGTIHVCMDVILGMQYLHL